MDGMGADCRDQYDAKLPMQCVLVEVRRALVVDKGGEAANENRCATSERYE